MEKEIKENDIDAKDLPQSEVFTRKEVFQHPQPADTGEALRPQDPKQTGPTAAHSKEEEKSSKEEGLNEASSPGEAGAFEGFEDQSADR
ncbi:MAG: hypothetical protein V4725_11505 [Bacteroidota bacterium]